jgi:hypothetical protein
LESNDFGRVYRDSVALVRDNDGAIFTCGMHLFQLPDAQLWLPSAEAAVTWLDALCQFQLYEAPALRSGHTFRPTSDDARRVLERWPDHRHHSSDGRYNPYGLWRVVTPGPTTLTAAAVTPTITPSLVALLSSHEQRLGRPLSREEVDTLARDAPAIALDARTIARMEQARGYADIEPERAWEQWLIVREALRS